MSAGKLTWGRRDWLGLMVLFLSSIAADVIGALLAVKGILPMGSVAAWVYGGWALGAFLGVRVAVRGRSGTVQASLLLAAGAYVLIWLVGLTVFGTAAFAHHGLGITLAVVAFKDGRIMRKNTCMRLHPSIMAASSSSLGIVPIKLLYM